MNVFVVYAHPEPKSFNGAPQLSYDPARATDDERNAMLENWRRRLDGLFDEDPITVSRY